MSIQRKIKKRKITLENSREIPKKEMSFIKKAGLVLFVSALVITLLIGLEKMQFNDIKREFEAKGYKVTRIEHVSQDKTPFAGESDSKGDRVIKVYYKDKQSKNKVIYAKYNTSGGQARWKEK